jgi:sulfate permease, SulP family
MTGARRNWFTGARTILALSPSEYPREIAAGLTLAALMVPLNIGYAQIAGLPPEVGLYAAVVPILGYALLSTSRHVVASPDAVIAALIASSIGGMAVAGSAHYVELAAAQALVCAAVFSALWWFRLGFLANFLSRAVLVGFLAGLGIEVLFGQIQKILGYKAEADGFIREVIALAANLPQIQMWSVVVGLMSITIVVVLKRTAPALPGALVALVATTIAVAVFDLDAMGVKVLGDVPSGLPTLAWPRLSFAEWGRLVPSAVAIVGVTVAEGLLLGRSLARKHDEEFDDDTDLLGYSASNALAGLFGTFAVGSSASRSAALDSMGSRSQLPSIVAAGVVAVAVLFFSKALAALPEAALAGIVAVAVLGLIDLRQLRYLLRSRRSEFWIAFVCMACVLLFGPLVAVFVAFALSTIDVVRRLSHPETAVLLPSVDGSTYVRTDDTAPPREAVPGVIVYRFGAALQFSNARAFFIEVERLVTEHGECRVFVLDAQAVSDIDSTGAETLEQVARWLKGNSTKLALTRVSSRVREQLRLYGLFDEIDEQFLFDTNRAAVDALAAGSALPADGDSAGGSTSG